MLGLGQGYLPSSSSLPMSPECSQPSSSITSLVFRSSLRYPMNTCRPRKQISPSPLGPGLSILISAPAITLPVEPVRWASTVNKDNKGCKGLDLQSHTPSRRGEQHLIKMLETKINWYPAWIRTWLFWTLVKCSHQLNHWSSGSGAEDRWYKHSSSQVGSKGFTLHSEYWGTHGHVPKYLLH